MSEATLLWPQSFSNALEYLEVKVNQTIISKMTSLLKNLKFFFHTKTNVRNEESN